jgi:hypothetical protein
MNLAPRGEICPQGVNTLYCLEERWVKQRIFYPQRDNFVSGHRPSSSRAVFFRWPENLFESRPFLPTGDTFEKLEDEDEQGWCKGRKDGKVGLYPANYIEVIE